MSEGSARVEWLSPLPSGGALGGGDGLDEKMSVKRSTARGGDEGGEEEAVTRRES